jgi:N-glycosylase/DNA lyase
MTSRFAIPVPSDFDFRATVLSHGWCNLAPFAWDMDAAVLERPLRVPGRPTVTAAFRQPGGRGAPVEVAVRGGRGARERRAIEEAAVVMLRLGADLSPFYARCRGAGRPFATARRHGFGRLLRSPTLFEDLAKILATTNTTWSGTKSMVVKLIALCATDGAFPSPDEVAAAGTGRVRDEARWGYRAAALVELAEKVAGGGLDLARWESWEGSSEELEAEVRSLRGFGPYAAAHVLALLGRHDFIAVDTVFRTFVRRRHFPRSRKAPTDRRMMAVYDGWGEWRGLAYWYEMWAEVMEDRKLLEAL